MLLGAIEAGGTKFVCAVGNTKAEVLHRHTIATTTPEETLTQVIEFFTTHPVQALGVGAFGPVDVNPLSPKYGTILQTPKIKWQNYPLRHTLTQALNIPLALQTDVNVAALGEGILGQGKGLPSLLYLTIGTGVGGGYVQNGQFLPTLHHAEMGHLPITRYIDDLNIGVCPFHGDCLEGLICGPAIEKRSGKPSAKMTADDPFWQHWSGYLAQALMSYALTLSPHRIVIGGGVMNHPHLLPLLRQKFATLMNGYIEFTSIERGLESYMCSPKLGNDSGIIGGLLLANAHTT
jgi:fructokinase